MVMSVRPVSGPFFLLECQAPCNRMPSEVTQLTSSQGMLMDRGVLMPLFWEQSREMRIPVHEKSQKMFRFLETASGSCSAFSTRAMSYVLGRIGTQLREDLQDSVKVCQSWPIAVNELIQKEVAFDVSIEVVVDLFCQIIEKLGLDFA